ncbi:hypothetical protein ACIRST_03620 [Kitasatospora sp. NPDC101447]|uniref:hypothetical protein n=1 Tax=Kitasatospora sp. NPDC101447 TaxID=3364102 RepID=UPI0037FEB896
MTGGGDGNGQGGTGRGGSGPDDEATARRLIAAWLAGEAAEPAPAPAAGAERPAGAVPTGAVPTGWCVPPAAAREVIAVARRMALHGRQGRAWPAPGAEHLMLARALVVDEHPSAAAWSERERVELAGWIAVLVRRFGEDGVQQLTAALAARS